MSVFTLGSRATARSPTRAAEAVAVAAMIATVGGLTGLLAMSAEPWLVITVALGIGILLTVVLVWRLEGAVVALLIGSLLPLPTVAIGTAHFGLATLAVPLIALAGILVSRRRGIPPRVPYLAVYGALLAVGVVSVVTSWLFWDPRVPTGMARGYGHRWIGYQLTALYLLAFPLVAFAAGVLISRLVRLERIYGWIFAVIVGLSAVVIVNWLHQPLNPLDAFAQGARPKADNQWAAYLVVMSAALAVHARRSPLRLLAVLMLAVGVAATIVSYVLGAWVGILAALTVIVWHRFRGRGLFLWLGILATGALVLQSIVATIVQQRALSPDVDRLGLWQSALTVWTKSPVVGVGPGNLASYMETYSQFSLGLVLQGYQQAHNMFLELLSENGIAGMAVLIAFLFVVVRTLVRTKGSTVTESFGTSAALGMLVASAGIAAFGSGFVPTIGSAGYNALPMVAAVWLMAGCGVGIACRGQGRNPPQAVSDGLMRSRTSDD